MALKDNILKPQLTKTSAGLFKAPLAEAAQGTITPAGQAQTPGINPDQAKMAGTPNQVMTAVREAQAPEPQQLSTFTRTAQPSTQQTEQQRQEVLKGQQLLGLAGISKLTDSLMKKAFEASGQPVTYIADRGTITSQLKNTPNAGNEEVTTRIQNLYNIALSGKKLTTAELNEISGYLGKNVTQQDIEQAKRPNTFELSEVAKDKIAKSSTLDKVDPKELKDATGFNSLAELAGVLGKNVADVGKMTVPDLQAQVDKLQKDEFNHVAVLQTLMNDPTASAVERANARRNLVNLGYAGLTSIESRVNNLDEQIKNADSLMIAGQEMHVEDILKSDTVTTIITNALSSPEKMEALAKDQPILAKWIQDNAQALEKYKTPLDESAKAFADEQVAKSAKARIADLENGELGDTLTKLAFGDDWQKPGKGIPQDPPFLEILRGSTFSIQQRRELLDGLKLLAETNPEMGKWLLGQGKDFLAKNGIYDHPDKIFTLANNLKIKNEAGSIEAHSNPNGFWDILFSAPDAVTRNSKLENTNKILLDKQKAKTLGLETDTSDSLDIFDVNGDGKLDEAEYVQASLKDNKFLGSDFGGGVIEGVETTLNRGNSLVQAKLRENPIYSQLTAAMDSKDWNDQSTKKFVETATVSAHDTLQSVMSSSLPVKIKESIHKKWTADKVEAIAKELNNGKNSYDLAVKIDELAERFKANPNDTAAHDELQKFMNYFIKLNKDTNELFISGDLSNPYRYFEDKLHSALNPIRQTKGIATPDLIPAEEQKKIEEEKQKAASIQHQLRRPRRTDEPSEEEIKERERQYEEEQKKKAEEEAKQKQIAAEKIKKHTPEALKYGHRRTDL